MTQKTEGFGFLLKDFDADHLFKVFIEFVIIIASALCFDFFGRKIWDLSSN